MRRRQEIRIRRRATWTQYSPWLYLLISIPILLVIANLIYRIPAVYSRVSWRIDALRTSITYAINPPEEAVFLPGEGDAQLAAIVQATLQSVAPLPDNSVSPTSEGPSATPTVTPVPIPESVFLEDVKFEDQHGRWNYCGPANLSMSLTYWGWDGNRDTVARVIKPGTKDLNADFLEWIKGGKADKNVMPYEMQNFVTDETEFGMVVRHGGDIELIKRLIAAGFPPVVEKGYYEEDYRGVYGWMGHFQFTTGYDELKEVFTVQDTWLRFDDVPGSGANLEVPYDEFIEGWRSFNYLFMVTYPPEREAELFSILGPWGDHAWANQHALDVANQEIQNPSITGIDAFFAWFNKGTSHVQLFEYVDAASAYDVAFFQYNQLGVDPDPRDPARPFRIMWYQTGPYWAYYWSGRYQDTINLANTTLFDVVDTPTLEESLYWRGKALEASGDLNGAIADYLETVRLNRNFIPGISELQRLGVGF